LEQYSPEYFEKTVKHLATVGIPEDCIFGMSTDQLSSFVEFIAGQEKK
jgi:hypothetical protein